MERAKDAGLFRYMERPADLPDHLGGSSMRSHYDPVTLMYLRDRCGVRTMIDLGCGPGANVITANRLGIEAWGIDGDPNCLPDLLHDFTKGPLHPAQSVDLVWSMEFLEHVEEQYLDNFMPVFEAGKYAMVTFAPPGHPGHHHVNCQPQEYWVDVFAARGMQFMADETAEIRKRSSMCTVLIPSGVVRSPSHKQFIARNGLLFYRG